MRIYGYLLSEGSLCLRGFSIYRIYTNLRCKPYHFNAASKDILSALNNVYHCGGTFGLICW